MMMKRAGLPMFFLAVALLPLVLRSGYKLNVMVFAGIHVLLALGLNLVMGYTGQVSLGHAAFYGMGAYGSGVLTTKLGMDPWLAAAAALGISMVIALVIGIPSLHLEGYYLSVATLGFGIILHIVFIEMASLTGGPSGLATACAIGLPSDLADPDLDKKARAHAENGQNQRTQADALCTHVVLAFSGPARNQGRADNERSSDGPFYSSDVDPDGINGNIVRDGWVDCATRGSAEVVAATGIR
jgi:ABC-type branched-subunit amino acid transport system permease subunit